ncbi:MAG TPA: hypothetical protein VLK03_00885 [Nocardioides sp.]|nr:hypothetical protein [Nocardioides sp.]
MTENSETQPDPASSSQTPQSSAGTSPADADHSGDTASPSSETIGGISDDQLPEDLQPGEDNPLAEPLDPDDEATKSREELEMDATQEMDDKIANGDEGSGDGAQGAGISEG